MDETAPGIPASQSPWLRPIVRTPAYDTLAICGVLPLTLIAWLGLGHHALLLTIVSIGSTMLAGHFSAVLLRRWRWTCVAPSPRYLLFLGIVACLLLRPTDTLLRSLVTGILTGVASLWVGRYTSIRIHPAVLAVAITWPMASAWTTPEPTTANTASVLRVPDWPDPIATGEPILEPRHSTPLVRFVLTEIEQIAAQPQRLPRMILDGTLPPLEPVLWNPQPPSLGMVSIPAILLASAWLLRWRVLHWRVPVYGLLAASAVVALSPGHGDTWTVLEAFIPLGTGALATWIAYVLLATPLPLMTAIVAGYAMPISIPGRAIYAAVIGVTGTIAMVITQQPEGLLLGVIIAGLLSRPLDHVRSSPFVPGRLVD
ncbi:MAG: RnfABCDGE type electron transport complex subunit D [Phycisphaeraceae bacterium]